MSKNCCGCKRVDLKECEVDEVTNIGAGTGLVFYTTSTGGNEIKSLTSNDGTVVITDNGDEVDLSVGPPGGVNIYNSDGIITDPVRTIDVGTNKIFFDISAANSEFIVNNNSNPALATGPALYVSENYGGSGFPGASLSYIPTSGENYFTQCSEVLSFPATFLGYDNTNAPASSALQTMLKNLVNINVSDSDPGNNFSQTLEIDNTAGNHKIKLDCDNIEITRTLTTNNANTELLGWNNVSKAVELYDTSAIPSQNIYNTDGTFTGNRTVSNGGFDFNYQGTGTGIFNIQNNDDAALVSQSQLNLGSGGGGTLNLYGGSSNIIRMFNIQNIATSDVLYYNSGTGLVSYGATPGGVPDEGFAVQWLNTNINTTTGTITINPATTAGWTQTVNFNSGMYNAGTGQFTFPSTGRYSYSMQVTFSSNIPAQNYLSFVQVTLPGYGIFPFAAASIGPYWRTQVLPPTLRINESIGTSGIVEFPIGTASTVDLTYSNVSTAATNPSSILVAITVHRIY